MTTPRPPFIADWQKLTDMAFPAPALQEGASALLALEADMLARTEDTMMGWIERRRAAVAEAQSIFGRLKDCDGPAAFMQLQAEWMRGSFQRMMEDARAFQGAALASAERAMRSTTATTVATATAATKAAETMKPAKAA